VTRRRALPLLLVAGAAACGGSNGDLAGPSDGTLVVTAATTGTDPDQDGYSVTVDGGTSRALPANGSDTIQATAGSHNLTLAGLAANCTLDGANPRPADVPSGGMASVQFDITCTPVQPGPGSIRVTIATSGEDADPDGYAVAVDGGAPAAFPIDGSQQIEVPAGSHQVELSNIASNCALSGANPIQVVVQSGATVDADFTVVCSSSLTAPGRDLALAWDREIYLLSADGKRFVDLTNNPPNSEPTWAPDGSRIAFVSARTGTGHIFVMNADGSGVTQLTSGSGVEFNPAWSPDGSKIAYSGGHIFAMKADGSQVTQLTSGSGFEASPAWSPDGTKIAFTGGTTDLDVYVMNADGSGITRLTTTAGEDDAPSWSPDGSKLVFQSTRSGNMQVYTMNSDGTSVVQLTFDTAPELDMSPAWSPDGAKIAFISRRTGTPQAYMMNPDGSDQVRLTSGTGGADHPAWRP